MYEDDKLARNVKNVESEKNSSGLRLMKLIEQMQQREWNPYKVDRYIEVVLFFIILTFIVIYFQIDTRHNEHGNGYHKEILPSTSLSYIKYGQPVPLADGNYPIAMPSQDSTIKINGQEVFPMLLILVPEIKDGQILDAATESALENDAATIPRMNSSVLSVERCEPAAPCTKLGSSWSPLMPVVSPASMASITPSIRKSMLAGRNATPYEHMSFCASFNVLHVRFFCIMS